MWLLAGLGNPGPTYAGTRHNVGFLVAEALASQDPSARWRSRGESRFALVRVRGLALTLVCPQTFMNRSGIAVREALEQAAVPTERLVVVHDDVDLPFGELRLKSGGGLGGHNGLRSIAAELGSNDFLRVRVGIGPSSAADLTDHVLGAWGADEARGLPDLVGRAADASLALVTDGFLLAANRWNRRRALPPQADDEALPGEGSQAGETTKEGGTGAEPTAGEGVSAGASGRGGSRDEPGEA